MKRFLLLSAAMSIGLTGCVKDENPNPSAFSDSKIAFEAPIVGSTTRIVPGEIDNSTAYPEKESFNVWGWFHSGDYTTFGDNNNGWSNYMTQENGNPVSVSKNGNTWAPATDYFWPKNGKLTFAAYSPAGASGTYSHTAAGLQIKGFTVADVDAQYDLMYSDRAYNRTTTQNNYSGTTTNPYTGVDIVFHHALSSIRFLTGTNANYASADIDFKIKSITIKNVANTGDFNETLTDANNSTTRTPAWTVTGEKTIEYVAFNGTYNVPEDGTSFSEPEGTKDLILLPQTFEGNDAAAVEVVYSMKTSASSEIEQTVTFQLNTATNAEKWEPNKRYTYRIIFSMNKITFAPIVEDWSDVTVTPDINL